jgi:hypothetical protein
MREVFKLFISIPIGFVVGLALMEIGLPSWAGPIAAGVVAFMVSMWLSNKGW